MKEYEDTRDGKLEIDSGSIWTRHMNDDIIYKSDGSQRRFEDELGEFTLTPVILKERIYDHNSLQDPDLYDGFSGYGLSTSSSRSFLGRPRKDRRTQGRIGLIMVLLLGALLISFGVGLLVHYWLMMQEQSHLNRILDAYAAKLSVPVLNQTYTRKFQNAASPEFQAIALPFCKELDKYFENSGLALDYHGCKVKSIRPEDNPKTCPCSSAVSVSDSALTLDIDLSLTDPTHRTRILDILRSKASKVDLSGLRLAFINNFLVEISKFDGDECLSDPCYNGGSCIDGIQSFSCVCTDGWTGPTCLIDKNECYDNPCWNGGICNNTDGSFLCNCQSGWTGDDCKTDVDECDILSPCVHGTCINKQGAFQCVCPSTWTGALCDTDANECELSPCQNGGTCTDYDGGFACTCPIGWAGSTCTEDVDECYFTPCQHDGTCHNIAGSYACRCSPGWYGFNCENNWNECALYPCVNNGTCVDTVGSFQCRCESGWGGQTCSDNIDECQRSPCMNGATCVDTPGAYTCQCPPDYTGPDCGNDFVVSFQYTSLILNRTFSDTLRDTQSLDFQKLAKPFIFQATVSILENPRLFPSFKEISVTSFRNSPYSIDWDIHFYGNVSNTVRQEALNYIMTGSSPIVFKNTISTRIGDLLVFLDNYTATEVSLELRVLNLTTDISDKDSIEFKWYAQAVCEDIGNIMRKNVTAYPEFRKCELIQILKDPVKLDIRLTFEGDFPVKELQRDVKEYIIKSTPLLEYHYSIVYTLGTLLIHYQDVTSRVNMEFQVMNLTWTSDLLDMASPTFKQHADLFGADMTTLLGFSSQSYPFRQVESLSFRNNPVTITSVLTFKGNHSEEALVANTSDVIFQNTPQYSYNGKIVNLIGDLLVYFSKWDNILHDAWLANMTLSIHDFLYEPDLADPSSQRFEDFQSVFCNDIDAFMSTSVYSDRYYRCFVAFISNTDPATLTFKMVFNGTDGIPDQSLRSTLNTSAQHITVAGQDTMYIGNNIFSFGDVQRIAVNMSDYLTTTVPTTTVMSVNIQLNVTFTVLNLNYSSDLADRTSAAFASIETPFCHFFDKLCENRYPDQRYDGCKINYFTTNPDRVNFDLSFNGVPDPVIRDNTFMALVENAPRRDVNNQIAIMLGPLAIFEQTLITGG
ncbi:uncharacterized protein LOC132549433 [Ylistrum balloti]|uniref:uncharacterized protein LOC132549433 n=1 Tax=Ylistrum balloti TaxID=509963 RepID=UPI002905AE62|nr:uncharacterized protein LOC132549433 [Ylistrum balloti]